jgi:hypothetical protein
MKKAMVAPVSLVAQAPEVAEADMRRRRSLVWCFVCSGCFVVSMTNSGGATARAQSSPQPTAASAGAYDRFIDDGLQAYDAGRVAEARTAFRRAHELNPTARTLRTIGMCSFNLGDYADAVWNLERARAETRKPLTEEQQKQALDLITKANQHIGRFRVHLDPPEASLLVDGRAPLLLDQAELLSEAGIHDIEARAPGYQTAHSTLNVDGGDRTTLVLNLVAEASESAVARAGANLPAPPPESREGSAPLDTKGEGRSLQSTLGYVSLVTGIAGLVGFGVTSGLAIADKGTLDDHCPNDTCGRVYRSTVERYDALRTASTLTLIAGGVFTVLGGTLLLARPSEHERVSQSTLEPILGPGSVGLRGRL